MASQNDFTAFIQQSTLVIADTQGPSVLGFTSANFYMFIGAVSVKVKSTCCGTSYGPYISAMFVYIRNFHPNCVNVCRYEYRSCC